MDTQIAQENSKELIEHQNGEGNEIIRETLRMKHPMEILLKNGLTPPALKKGDVVTGAVIEKRAGRLFLDIGQLKVGIVYGREYAVAQEIIKTLGTGDTVHAKIVEFDNEEGYVELSLQDAGVEKKWLEMETARDRDEILELEVKKANSGGLILEYMGTEGFLPTSQLSGAHYPRVEGGEKEKILEVLQKLVATKLKVKILDLDQKERKLIFTEKGLDASKFKEALAQYHIGQIVEGEVTGVRDFGAFIKFDPIGLEGLIHLSELDWGMVEDPRELVKVGAQVYAKIIDIRGDKI
ncbi:MAG: 30S ribosomal protein S1, partial [Parcubacteria group bacterium Gr01-1014_66]